MSETTGEARSPEHPHAADISVREDVRRRRFELLDGETVIGATHWVPFEVSDETVRIFHHTTVDEAYGGQGLASMLVRHASDRTAEEGITLVPVCPYVKRWLEKHEDHPVRRSPVRPEHLEAIRNA
ncbi:MAG: GNAT family N-acetyltransferase [Nesterenkonia sp.]|uniref:GNAT family N-acetyltransferase n=1 Tax=Nesterenkonia marinintestina TaxID=2979865 RepID=UPI0021BFF715|nr:GNAT family N-acetyltransferase [Nesterenkonia sp. GX14115]MDO5493594.1 GNAT family N-acetyltransferase [Nesterenkonia sp.]